MINQRYSSYVPLLNQLKKYGKFTSYFSINSPSIKEILDYLYSELKFGIESNRLPHNGTFFTINGPSNLKIFVTTYLSVKASRIKCFTLQQKEDFDVLVKSFDQISRVYTNLFFQCPRYVPQEITVMYREVSE